MPNPMMSDAEAATLMAHGFKIMFEQARLMQMLPLEDWLAAFDRAEGVAPMIDPTLYREYIYSGKGDAIKEMIRACLGVKQTFLKLRDDAIVGRIKR